MLMLSIQRFKKCPSLLRSWHGSGDSVGELGVDPSIKFPPCQVLPGPAPLLEEERNTLSRTGITNLSNPVWHHRSSLRATLSTDNHPSDAFEVQFTKGLQQRFTAEETNLCRCIPQHIHPGQPMLKIFNRSPPPNIRQLGGETELAVQELCHPVRPLRENLIGMPRSGFHHPAYSLKVARRNVPVEQVGHGVYEHSFG